MELEEVVARYVLGYFPLEELPSAAADALGAGLDSESLRQLAGSQGDDVDVIDRLFNKSIEELAIRVPSESEAARLCARSVARDVLRGSVSPYDGARKIWQIYVKCPDAELRLFVGFASEYEDDIRHRDEYARLIVEECGRLVRSA